MIYLIGSLRNAKVLEVARQLREAGHDVFDDWYAAGTNADDHWRDYEKQRGRTFKQALEEGTAAKHVFDYDFSYLKRADTGVLVAPAGKSAHLELGWLIGQGKRGYILLEHDTERWDVMYQLATKLCWTTDELLKELAS